MHHVYEKLTEEAVIGQFEKVDGKKRPKPFAEYPKLVTGSDGKRHRVLSLNEEMEVIGPEFALKKLEHDPLAAEKRELAHMQEVLEKERAALAADRAKVRAKLDEFEGVSAVRSESAPPAPEPNALELGKAAREAGEPPLVSTTPPAPPATESAPAAPGEFRLKT